MKVSIYCPHCHRHTALSMGQVDGSYCSNSRAFAICRDGKGYFWWIGLCNNCGNPSMVKEQGCIIYPNPIPEPTDTRVPEPIRKDLDEAKVCLSVNAFCAATIMARRTIQSVVIEKGHTKGRLVDQIDAMAAAGQITSDVRDWAHLVRAVGNDGAHPNDLDVGREDAEDVINLAEQLLQIVYVAPAIAANRRAARTP